MWISNASRAQIASLATNARQVISELTRTVSHAKTGSVLSAQSAQQEVAPSAGQTFLSEKGNVRTACLCLVVQTIHRALTVAADATTATTSMAVFAYRVAQQYQVA